MSPPYRGVAEALDDPGDLMSPEAAAEPYRTVDSPATDGEIACWDRAIAAAITRSHFRVIDAAGFADEALKARRERFGRR